MYGPGFQHAINKIRGDLPSIHDKQQRQIAIQETSTSGEGPWDGD